MHLVLIILAASSHSQALSGAVLTADRPEVGELALDSGESCTGTLIGPTTVLTAAQCATTASRFFIGSQSRRVTSVRIHPLVGRPTSVDSDLAVLELDAIFMGVNPVSLRSRAPVATLPLELYGFGRDELGSTRQKRRATANVATVSGATFTMEAFGSSACAGDAGGPAFTADGALVGIITGALGECGGQTRLVTVNAYLPWITKATDTPPTAELTRPGDAATMPTTFTINARVSDDVVLHEWLVDDVMVQQAATIGTEPLAELELTAGDHVVEFGAFDGSGQRAFVKRKFTIERSVVPPRASGAACWDNTDCVASPCVHYRCAPTDGCSTTATFPMALLALLAVRRRFASYARS
ncbi:MAG: S1 family peptidase [Archangium sp.]